MGQYYLLANPDKYEYVDPWSLGGIAKFVEWCTCPHNQIIPYLIGLCNGHGGGDIDPEGKKFLGRWAGDRVILVGDYWGDQEGSPEFAHLFETIRNQDPELLKERMVSIKQRLANPRDPYIGYNRKEDAANLKEFQKKLEVLESGKIQAWTNISKALKKEYEAEMGANCLDLNSGVQPQLKPDMVITATPKEEQT